MERRMQDGEGRLKDAVFLKIPAKALPLLT
jgi:hypothetical protein